MLFDSLSSKSCSPIDCNSDFRSTYTGQYEDVAGLNDQLLAHNKAKGLDVYIHVRPLFFLALHYSYFSFENGQVDAASGGFVAPFVNPSLIWDFRLPLVCSINTVNDFRLCSLILINTYSTSSTKSGHKYGLCYAGVGWAIWRGKNWLPDEILFTVNCEFEVGCL